MYYLGIFFIFQLFVFYKFYRRRDGHKAVYHTWYAWIIDTFAVISGVFIMSLSVFLLYNQWVFSFDVNDTFFYLGFLVGSWQFSIHAIKALLRTRL
jgi:hypothetical protein